MGKRCIYTLTAIFAGLALIAAEGDAVVIRSATSGFNIPAKQKLDVKTALARLKKRLSAEMRMQKPILDCFISADWA